MRSRAVLIGSRGGRTKTVSERLNSAAIFCIAVEFEPFAFNDDCERIAGQRAVGEDVEQIILAAQGRSLGHVPNENMPN